MPAQRYSRQRELIFNTVCASHAHPTAEMVYNALKPEHPNLSLGTVYRNLHLLADEGKLRRMPFPVERFDGDLHPHCHFCCQRCGAVTDVDLPYDHALDGAVQSAVGAVSHHTTVFYGLCAACGEKEDGDRQEVEGEAVL